MSVHASAILYDSPDCAVPDCPWPSTWTFEASGDEGVFEVVIGILIEPGDTVRLCGHHTTALRNECLAREAKMTWLPPDEREKS